MTVAGLALIRMGQYPTARMALERALKLKPDQFEAAVALGELNLDLGSPRRGADVLEMAARLRPREFGVWRVLGRALADLNDTAGAAHAYQKALELEPNDRGIMIELIALLINSGQSESAHSWVAQALQRYPDDPVVLGLAAGARSTRIASRRPWRSPIGARARSSQPGRLDGPRALPGRPIAMGGRLDRRRARRRGGAERPRCAPVPLDRPDSTGSSRLRGRDAGPTRSGPEVRQADG